MLLPFIENKPTLEIYVTILGYASQFFTDVSFTVFHMDKKFFLAI